VYVRDSLNTNMCLVHDTMTVGGPHISATVKLPSKPTCWDTKQRPIYSWMFLVDTIKDYQAFKDGVLFQNGKFKNSNILDLFTMVI